MIVYDLITCGKQGRKGHPNLSGPFDRVAVEAEFLCVLISKGDSDLREIWIMRYELR